MVILFHISQTIFLGPFAVGCFFILSGYWISLMYEKEYSKTQNALKVFYISRLWRLLPTFYIFTVLAIITNLIVHYNLFVNLSHLQTFHKAIFFISNLAILGYAQSKVQIIGTAWSLDIELQFYLLFPLFFYFLKDKKQFVYLLTGLLFLVSCAILINNQVNLSQTVFYYLFLFLIGFIIYFNKIRLGKKAEIIGLSMLFLIFTAHLIIPSLRAKILQNQSGYFKVVSLVMIFAAIPALINSVHNLSNKFDRFLGEMSFMLYLSHRVWVVPYNLLIANIDKLSRIPYALAFLGITILSSYLVYKFVDRPSEKLRHSWVKKQLLKDTPEINAAQDNKAAVIQGST
ncbi:acyltransferase family protein [Mucilaginibacter sp. X4EP1]|uniref:acyltransferase family protein n=1 Tax=Mucilaginibacter sp. X4EP1 TaxID=2723092 RepID=UPI003B00422C